MPPLIALVIPAVLLTAVLSGVFGMAGGFVLMIVYVSVLPTAPAMVLHGVTQLASNGSRAFLLFPHARLRPAAWVACGSLCSLGLALSLRFMPSKAFVYLALGVIPFAMTLVPRHWIPSIERPGAAFACGVVATAAQLTAGVSGPLLDAFFVQCSLDRRAVVATKALTQTCGHALKLVYFGTFLFDTGDVVVGPCEYVAAVLSAFAGTSIGRVLLERLGETGFRRGSAWLVRALAVVCAARGAQALLV